MNGRWKTRIAVTALASGVAFFVAPAVTDAVAGVTGIVQTAGHSLNARSGPATSYRVTAKLRNRSRVTVVCRVQGEFVDGVVRNTAAWDRLANGRYVSDAYVRWPSGRPTLPFCGGGGAVVHTHGAGLNMRSGPSTGYQRVGILPNGSKLTVHCQVYGQMVDGAVRRTAVWDRLARGRYVSDAFVQWTPGPPSSLPWCGEERPERMLSHSQFITWAAGFARQSKAKYRVPASVTIAQAILESGWGRSGLSKMDHNYFGIKCFGSPGPIAIGCRSYRTSECVGRKCYRTSAQFRVYRNAADSFLDHGRFLVVNPRYRKAFSYVNNPDQFAREIHKAGYATSPTYATSLIRLMRQYNLYRYDR
jgi:uncharacterized protein YraI